MMAEFLTVGDGDFTAAREHEKHGRVTPVAVGEFIVTYRTPLGDEIVTHKEHWQSLPFASAETHKGSP